MAVLGYVRRAFVTNAAYEVLLKITRNHKSAWRFNFLNYPSAETGRSYGAYRAILSSPLFLTTSFPEVKLIPLHSIARDPGHGCESEETRAASREFSQPGQRQDLRG